MASNEHRTGLEGDLSHAIDELHEALQRAADATASIQQLLPRVSAVTGIFADLDNVIRAGREAAGVGEQPAATRQPYTGPTLLVPSPPATAPQMRAEPQAASREPAPQPPISAPNAQQLVSFRLEFESNPGPLDLRTVDDAVSEHPAVRDVALLDFDGRKATLKVWIEATASPTDVQSSLVERASELFGAGNAVTIVALEDAA